MYVGFLDARRGQHVVSQPISLDARRGSPPRCPATCVAEPRVAQGCAKRGTGGENDWFDPVGPPRSTAVLIQARPALACVSVFGRARKRGALMRLFGVPGLVAED